MSGERGRLEAQLTVPTGGWDIAVTGTSSGTATIPAGTYYPTAFAAEVASQLSSTTGDTVTCAIDSGESGDGKTTIATDGGTLSITWTDTESRDILGYTGNLSGSLSYESPNHVKGLWLPDCPMYAPYGPQDAGAEEADTRGAETPAGDVFTIYGQRKTVLEGLRWDAVTHARARIAGESVTGESYQQFYRDALLGERSYFQPGPSVRLYWDADAGNYDTYRMRDLSTPNMSMLAQDTTLLWTIEPGRMVVVP